MLTQTFDQAQATEPDADQGSALAFVVVMTGVFFLLSCGLMMAVNFLAAQAATTAAQRGLAIAQTPGQTEDQADDVITGLATASGVITNSSSDVSIGPETVQVAVQVETVLGSTISRTATGPMLRFVPQEHR